MGRRGGYTISLTVFDLYGAPGADLYIKQHYEAKSAASQSFACLAEGAVDCVPLGRGY